MRIEDFRIGKILGARSDNIRVSKAKAGTPAASPDQVSISNRAVEINKAQQLASSLPEVREEKVAQYQRMIANNEYKITDEELANAIFDNILSGTKGS